jgi:mannose-6-phosphate isomerase-like protein (cupin superfamily)
VYVVLAGRGALEVEGERIDVGPGRVVSVDVGADHQFVDVTEDLSVLVVFAPAATPD